MSSLTQTYSSFIRRGVLLLSHLGRSSSGGPYPNWTSIARSSSVRLPSLLPVPLARFLRVHPPSLPLPLPPPSPILCTFCLVLHVQSRLPDPSRRSCYPIALAELFRAAEIVGEAFVKQLCLTTCV